MRWKLSQSFVRFAFAFAVLALLSLAGQRTWVRAAEPEAAPQEAPDDEPRSLEEEPLEPAPLDDDSSGGQSSGNQASDDPPAEETASEGPSAEPQTEPAEAPRDPYADEPATPAAETPDAADNASSDDKPADAAEPAGEDAAAPTEEDQEPGPSPKQPKATAITPVAPPARKPKPPVKIESRLAPQAESKPDSQPDATASPAPARVALDPATLDGVHPGTTTRDELHVRWGQPQRSQRIAGGVREFFDLDKLGNVQATIFENVVSSLTVQIGRPLPLEAVAERLALADVEPVGIFGEKGELLGAAFPERGVLLGYMPGARPPKVFQIVVEAVDAQPFLARAEARLPKRCAESLADVEQALSLAPDHPEAHHLHGKLLLQSGKLDEAMKSAERADELEPQAPQHRLLLAQILAASGDYPVAITRVRGVLDEPKLDDLVAARAWCQWGDYLAQSHKRDFTEAIKHHQQAISLAEPLLASPDQVTRRAAKQLLLDAHLGVAYDIGHGRWQQKTAAVAKWINRSAVFADDLVRTENAGAETRLRVYVGALAAIAGISEPPDVTSWIAGTRQLGQRIFEEATDSTYRGQVAWKVGRALSDAVEIETARGRSDEAFTAGTLARSLLEEAKSVAQTLPIYDYECGKLCFRMGVAYAIEREDHAQAVVWFDRAAPLLESPVPIAAIDAGAHGETFVSMAVSYWDQENKPEAMRLTNQGLKMMEQAVEDNTLEAAALSVPYGNLSAMHEELGDQEQAKWCADLAARYEGTRKK
jgi:tetratricopeptide (TPR) repeat protein